jgi:hypothetical protein
MGGGDVEKEADKAARDFTASIASAYRLSTSKIALSNLNKDIRTWPGKFDKT